MFFNGHGQYRPGWSKDRVVFSSGSCANDQLASNKKHRSQRDPMQEYKTFNCVRRFLGKKLPVRSELVVRLAAWCSNPGKTCPNPAVECFSEISLEIAYWNQRIGLFGMGLFVAEANERATDCQLDQFQEPIFFVHLIHCSRNI